MANWNQFLTNIYNLILQKHHSQQSTAFYVPFEDTLSKSLAFDEIAKQLFNKEIIGNGTAMYTDFGDNDITDKYKLSFTDKFFKPILLSVNGAIPGFGTAGISFKYD
ncbi:DNA repair protein, partial [Streptococcus phocae subsp. salmonis]